MRRIRWTLVAAVLLCVGFGGYLYFGPMALPRQSANLKGSQNTGVPGKGSHRPYLQLRGALPVFSISLSADDKHMVVASKDRVVHVWDLVQGSERPGFDSEVGAIRAAVLSADGRWLAATDEHIVHLWDFASGAEVCVFRGHKEGIESLAMSADGSRVATGARDGARLWDKSADQALHVIRGQPGFRIKAVALSADGKWLATGGDDRIVHLWNADTGAEVRSFIGHTDPIRAIVFSADGKRLFTASEDETACSWDVANGTLERSYFHDDKVVCLAASRDGKWLAAGGEDRQTILFDVASAKPVHALRGHTSVVRAVAFTSDGRRLLTGGGGEGDAMRLWDTATGNQLCEAASFKFTGAEVERGWAVKDADNNFDASNRGNMPGLNWVAGSATLPLTKLKDNYTPGLLAKHLFGK